MTRSTIHNIITNDLKLNKLCSRLVPHFLTDEQKKERVRICKANLKKLKSRTWRMCDVVTGDETWIYHRAIDDSQSWVAEGEIPSTAVRRSAREPKTVFCIFFMTKGPVLIHQVPSAQSVNASYYRTNCLEPLVEKIKKKRPASGTHAFKVHVDNARPHKGSIVKSISL
jgi:histone-lysine N-methyltransferase SETMAR